MKLVKEQEKSGWQREQVAVEAAYHTQYCTPVMLCCVCLEPGSGMAEADSNTAWVRQGWEFPQFQ